MGQVLSRTRHKLKLGGPMMSKISAFRVFTIAAMIASLLVTLATGGAGNPAAQMGIGVGAGLIAAFVAKATHRI